LRFIRTKRCRSDYGRREALNKEFERCCTFLAEMMEKYGALVMRDIAIEIQFNPDTWEFDAEGKRLRCEAYARRFMNCYVGNTDILREWDVIHRKSVQDIVEEIML
jgi:hypothetical protein